MSEIKSTLEIALERARALGDDQDGDQIEQGRKRGEILARNLLTGELTPGQMLVEMGNLPPTAGQVARRSAAQHLLAGLLGNPEAALGGLAGLTGEDAGPALTRLSQAVAAGAQTLVELDGELAAEMAQKLEAAGITGPALRPNPRTHPEFDERQERALGEARAAIRQAATEVLQIIG